MDVKCFIKFYSAFNCIINYGCCLCKFIDLCFMMQWAFQLIIFDNVCICHIRCQSLDLL